MGLFSLPHPADVAIVLSNKVSRDSSPSSLSAARLDCAYQRISNGNANSYLSAVALMHQVPTKRWQCAPILYVVVFRPTPSLSTVRVFYVLPLTDAGCNPPAPSYTHPVSGRTNSPPQPPKTPPALQTPLN
jgi:hypothetical protein